MVSKGKSIIEKPAKKAPVKKECSNCGEPRNIKDYYASDNPLDADGRVKMCKYCIKNHLNYDDINTVKNVLNQLNKPFIMTKWESAIESSKNTKAVNKDPFGIYMKILFLNYNGQCLTWKDSDETSSNSLIVDDTIQAAEVVEKHLDNILELKPISESDMKNKEDVIRMVGYDPFEYEYEGDKKNLYNKLVDFLDESTLEDSFKLPTVIEIVKSFNQIDKINSAISSLTSSAKSIADNMGGIKSLIDGKQKMLSAVLAMAKDNGISVNHNNSKSKGAGTLSGIIKQVQEKGIGQSDVNIYDIETCDGMRQVADISNKSILDQLMLNENDYTEMINDQRELILEYERKNSELEEENRLIKVELKNYKQKVIDI